MDDNGRDDVEVVGVLSQADRSQAARNAAILLDDDDHEDESTSPLAVATSTSVPTRAARAATHSAKIEPPSVCVGLYKKCVGVYGDTRPIKDALKRLGGRWNSSLMTWVFPASQRGDLLRDLAIQYPALTIVEQDEVAFLQTLQSHLGTSVATDLSSGKKNALSVSTYKKAIFVTGDTRPVKDQLKRLNGRWNPGLAGWIFGGKKPRVLLQALAAVRFPAAEVGAELFVSEDLREAVVAAGETGETSSSVAASSVGVSTASAATIAASSGAMGSATDRPKRPCSAYLFYSRAIRKELICTHPDATPGQLAKLMGAGWKALPGTANSENDLCRH